MGTGCSCPSHGLFLPFQPPPPPPLFSEKRRLFVPRPTRLVLGDQGTTDPGLSAHTHTPFLLVVGGGFLGTPAPTHMGCEWKGGHRSEAQEQHPAVRSWAWDTGPPALEGRARPERQKPHVRWALAPGGRGGGGTGPADVSAGTAARTSLAGKAPVADSPRNRRLLRIL